jgi:hypothetical protein
MEADILAALPDPAPLSEEVKRGQKRTLDVFYATQRLQLPEFPEQ